MEKSRIFVKLSEASVGVDCSDETVTLRVSLWTHKQTRERERQKGVRGKNIILKH